MRRADKVRCISASAMKNMINKLILATAVSLSMAVVSAAELDNVLLEQDTIKITQANLLDIVNTMVPEADRSDVLSNPAQLKALLLDLYRYRALANEGKAQKIDQEPLFVARMNFAYERSLALEYLETYLAQLKKPDFTEAAREAYIVKKQQFMLPEQVSAEHILIKAEDRTVDEALQLAKDVRAQALAGKKSFADLAVEFSEDPSVKNNQGSLGFFTRDRMVKEFSDGAFALKNKGDISEPIKTQFGYHIIRLVDKKAAKQRSFDEVKKQLIAEEEKAFLQKARTEKLTAIEQAPGVKINEQLLMNLKGSK